MAYNNSYYASGFAGGGPSGSYYRPEGPRLGARTPSWADVHNRNDQARGLPTLSQEEIDRLNDRHRAAARKQDAVEPNPSFRRRAERGVSRFSSRYLAVPQSANVIPLNQWASRMGFEPTPDYTVDEREKRAVQTGDPIVKQVSPLCVPWSFFQLFSATILMVIIAWSWIQSDKNIDPSKNKNGRVCLPVQCKMQWLLVFLDAGYLFFAGLFTRMFGQYPSERFFNKGPIIRTAILSHIAAGIFVVFYGGVLWIAYPTRDLTGPNILMGIAGCVHSISVFTMLPIVIGERRITIPLYAWAGGVNLYNAIKLLANPKSLFLAIRLWDTINVFVLVRFQLAALALYNMDLDLVYTYSLGIAGFLTYTLTLQPVELLYALATPTVYAPFHEWFMAKVGYPVESEVFAGRNTILGRAAEQEKKLAEQAMAAPGDIILTARKYVPTAGFEPIAENAPSNGGGGTQSGGNAYHSTGGGDRGDNRNGGAPYGGDRSNGGGYAVQQQQHHHVQQQQPVYREPQRAAAPPGSGNGGGDGGYGGRRGSGNNGPSSGGGAGQGYGVSSGMPGPTPTVHDEPANRGSLARHIPGVVALDDHNTHTRGPSGPSGGPDSGAYGSQGGQPRGPVGGGYARNAPPERGTAPRGPSGAAGAGGPMRDSGV